MRVSAAALVFVALASKVAAQMKFATCDYEKFPQAFQLTSVNWSPSPGCIGKELCAVGTGILTEPIFAPAVLALTGTYLGRIVYVDNHDLCALLAAQGTPCPIPAGPAVLKGCVKIKDTVPANIPGTFRARGRNGNNHLLFCTQVNDAQATKCA